MTKLIEKGTTIPVKNLKYLVQQMITNQLFLSMFLKSEREFARDNKSLGMFELSDIPPAQEVFLKLK